MVGADAHKGTRSASRRSRATSARIHTASAEMAGGIGSLEAEEYRPRKRQQEVRKPDKGQARHPYQLQSKKGHENQVHEEEGSYQNNKMAI